MEEIATRLALEKRSISDAVRRLQKQGAVKRGKDSVDLLPAGYTAVGSFPPKR